jgi:hypothetical protein
MNLEKIILIEINIEIQMKFHPDNRSPKSRFLDIEDKVYIHINVIIQLKFVLDYRLLNIEEMKIGLLVRKEIFHRVRYSPIDKK